jgi:hypothetical protein
MKNLWIHVGIYQVSYKCQLTDEHCDIQQFVFFSLPINITRSTFITQD